MAYDVVAIGNPVYDIIQTPSLLTEGRVLSGCSTNALLAVSRLGTKRVGLVGSVGSDFENRLKNDLSTRGITDAALKIAEQTGGFKLVYDSKGNRTLDVLGVAGRILPEDIPSRFLESRYILLGPILQEVDLGLVKFISENSNAEIFLDPQGMLRKFDAEGKIIHYCEREIMKQVVSLVHFVKPNEIESQVLTGETDPYLATRMLVEWGAKIGIVTLAEKGSIVCAEGQYLTVPAYATVAVDPTGAGDTYAGSFLVEYGRTNSLADSAAFASATASIMVENIGPDFPVDEDNVRRRSIQIRPQVRVHS